MGKPTNGTLARVLVGNVSRHESAEEGTQLEQTSHDAE